MSKSSTLDFLAAYFLLILGRNSSSLVVAVGGLSGIWGGDGVGAGYSVGDGVGGDGAFHFLCLVWTAFAKHSRPALTLFQLFFFTW